MASDSSTTASSSIPTVPLNPSQNLITINAAAQLPLKLTPTNYFSWQAQFRTLFYGLDLLGYLDGTCTCPPSTTNVNDQPSPNPDHTFWRRQDQLILHAILASVSEAVVPLISSATSSHEAWTRLSRLYAKRSNQHIIHLKDKLSMLTRGSSSVTDFLVSIKRIADELSALGAPPSDADLLLYSTRGLGPAYKELITALRTRDSVVAFEELFDKIIDHETFLQYHEKHNPEPTPPTVHLTKSNPHFSRQSKYPSSAPGILANPHLSKSAKPDHQNPNTSICQFCDKRGHDAMKCFKLFSHLHSQRPTANHVTTFSPCSQPWIVDSGASHHVTSQLSDLSMHQPYDGPDDIVIGDGSGLKITHTGSVTLSPSFHLSNVLCSPSINQNLISVSQFCRSNKTSIEFFPSHFLVKDLQTGKHLLRGKTKHDLYEWPTAIPTSKNSVAVFSAGVISKATPTI